MNAQSSVEFIFIFALIGMLGIIMFGNWFGSEKDLYQSISIRQEVVKALDSIDSNKFYLRRIDVMNVVCPAGGWEVYLTKVNIDVHPIPDSDMELKIIGAVKKAINESKATNTNVDVYVNNPKKFFEKTC